MLHPPPAALTPAPKSETVAQAGPAQGKRRLWHLPTQAHELLLATSFTPEVLRREAAGALGRMHRGVCVLKGPDVDVLYSVIHDMAARNPLSELIHKRLDERHALAVRRLASLRDASALQAAWEQALASDAVAGTLWALLTHPLGAGLETSALYDARAWVFAHCRRSVVQRQADAATQIDLEETRRQVEALRTRLAVQQQEAAAAQATARAEQARLAGELAGCQDLLAHAHAHAYADTAAIDHRTTTPGTRRPAPGQRPGPQAEAPPLAPATCPAPSSASHEPGSQTVPAPQPITVQGRRVLCVGGIQHAVSLYRSRIERLGGQFEHHDGGLENKVQLLDGRLQRADLVICQAACLNHEAYHRVKRHCERTGTPCAYLDRPSLARLDRALLAGGTDPRR